MRHSLLRRVVLVVVLAASAAVAACKDENVVAQRSAIEELNRIALPPGWVPLSEKFARGADTVWNLQRNYIATRSGANFVSDARVPILAAGWVDPWCAADGGSCHYSRNDRILWVVQQAPPIVTCPAEMPGCSLGTLKLEL